MNKEHNILTTFMLLFTSSLLLSLLFSPLPVLTLPLPPLSPCRGDLCPLHVLRQTEAQRYLFVLVLYRPQNQHDGASKHNWQTGLSLGSLNFIDGHVGGNSAAFVASVCGHGTKS